MMLYVWGFRNLDLFFGVLKFVCFFGEAQNLFVFLGN